MTLGQRRLLYRSAFALAALCGFAAVLILTVTLAVAGQPLRRPDAELAAVVGGAAVLASATIGGLSWWVGAFIRAGSRESP